MSDVSFNFILYVDVKILGGSGTAPSSCFRYNEKQAVPRVRPQNNFKNNTKGETAYYAEDATKKLTMNSTYLNEVTK